MPLATRRWCVASLYLSPIPVAINAKHLRLTTQNTSMNCRERQIPFSRLAPYPILALHSEGSCTGHHPWINGHQRAVFSGSPGNLAHTVAQCKPSHVAYHASTEHNISIH